MRKATDTRVNSLQVEPSLPQSRSIIRVDFTGRQSKPQPDAGGAANVLPPTKATSRGTTTCPCCGNAVQVDKPLVSLDTNTISWKGQTRAVTAGAQTTIVDRLVTRTPGAVSFDALVEAIWGFNDPPETANKVIAVQVCKLRKTLAPLGIEVRNAHNLGYYLVIL